MNTEEIRIIGILNEKEANGQIKHDEFKLLMCSFLQLEPMYKVIKDILIDEFQMVNLEKDKLNIDIFQIFKCLEKTQFYRNIPNFLNCRLTSGNIKIIKTSLILYTRKLLTMVDIRDAVTIFGLKELEHLTEGIPVNISVINGLLWKINKVISNFVLDEWIRRCSMFLEEPGILKAHEFLYLICNTENRRNYFNSIPKMPIKTRFLHVFDQKYFALTDKKFLDNSKNPDIKMQNRMIYHYNVENVIFEGMSHKNKEDAIAPKKKKLKIKKEGVSDDFNEFKKLLKDPELYVEIKTKLRNAYQILNHSKLSGKTLRYKILEEIQENASQFSNPLNLKTQIFSKEKQEKNLEKVYSNKYFKKITNSTQRPFSAELTQYKSDVSLNRKIFKRCLENEINTEENDDNEEIIKVDQPFLQTIPENAIIDKSKKKINKRITSASTAASKQKVFIESVLEEEFDTHQTKLNSKEANSKSMNNLIHYGSSRLANLRNYSIDGVKQIVNQL